MPTILFSIGAWILGSALARILVGAGLGVGTYAILSPLLDNFIATATSSFSGLMPEMLAIASIAGAGEAVSVLCSAMVGRMSIQSAMIFIGKT